MKTKDNLGKGTALCLTPRDVELLSGLFGCGLALRDQVHALYFPGCALRRVNRRLKALCDAGMIASSLPPLGPLSEPVAGAAPGSRCQRVYRATPASAGIIAATLGIDLPVVRQRLKTASREFAAHSLEIVNARVVFESAARRHPGVEVARFLPEPLVARSYEVRDTKKAGAPWRTEHFKPDALAVVQAGARTLYGFIEVDLSSVASAEMRQKLLIHERYRNLLFGKHYGADAADCLTLVLTTGAKRAANLAEIAAQEGIARARFADLSAFASGADPFFAPLWREPGREALTPLIDHWGPSAPSKENRQGERP